MTFHSKEFGPAQNSVGSMEGLGIRYVHKSNVYIFKVLIYVAYEWEKGIIAVKLKGSEVANR